MNRSQIDLRGSAAPINQLAAVSRFYREAQPDTETTTHPEVVVDSSERSVDGFIELSWEHLDIQRQLHLDYLQSTRDLSRDQLEKASAAIFDTINSDRDDPIDITTVDSHVLRKMSEPNWLIADEASLRGQPEYLVDAWRELQVVDAKLTILSQDDELRQAAAERRKEEMEVIKTATAWKKSDEKIAFINQKINAVYHRAGSSGRRLTRADNSHIERLNTQARSIESSKQELVTDPNQIPEISRQIERLMVKEWKQQLDAGLLMTESMRKTIDEMLPALVRGNPALLVGETGGAKTALAEYVSREIIGKEPELVSHHGDINTYQLIGKTDLREEGTVFTPGPAVRAMEQGRPLILDEVNAASPEFLKRLNKIMQLRPGDRFTIQEDSGREVVVQPGFCIIGTANEKSKRYKAVDDLSVEFQNRFGANIYRVRYPDAGTVAGELPVENMRLATATISDTIGEQSVPLPDGQLESFVRACHLTQRLFVGEQGQAETQYMDTSRLADNKPGLEETVLAPRTMTDIIKKVRDSYGQISLTQSLSRWLDGVKNTEDKRVLTLVLESHGLLQAAHSEDGQS